MGKISDALRKGQEERERKKQAEQEALQQTRAQEPVKNEHSQQAPAIEQTRPLPPPIPREETSVVHEPAINPVAQGEVSSSPEQFKLVDFLKQKAKFAYDVYTNLKGRWDMVAQNSVFVAKAKDDSGIDSRVITYYDYHSPVCDQYRIVRTNIKSYLQKQHGGMRISTATATVTPRFLTIASALHGEGKSITAANISVVLANDMETKVLIIDCDLRKGTIQKLFNINVHYGLSDVLVNDVDYRYAIYPTKLNNLFVMPSGNVPSKPLELLGSKKMKALFERLKSESFTHIVIDTPPLAMFSDASVIGAQTDGIIFVVQAYKTGIQVIKRAKELAESSHAKIIGFVLTHTDYHIPHIYGYYYYYQYRNKDKAKN